MKFRVLAAMVIAAGVALGVAAQPVAAAPKPFSTEEVLVERPWNAPATVTNVRYARHKGYDRVVVDFKGPFPGYEITWVKQLVADGSGLPINVKGKAFLQVRLDWARAHTDEGTSTWKGGPIYKPNLGNVIRVVRTGDYEGYVTIGLGLKKKKGFRVLELKQPNRIIIDVKH